MKRAQAGRRPAIDLERRSPLGPAAFAALRAEEEPWLLECFVPLPGFTKMLENRSVLIFGSPGSGKTAIQRALQASVIGTDGRPSRLLVHWRPSPLPPEALPDIAWVKRLTADILDACAASLVHHLARFPEDYLSIPSWAQDRLVWFIRRFTKGDPSLRWGPLASGEERGSELIRHILTTTDVPEVLYPDVSPEHVVTELISALEPLKMKGIWVLSDGLEGWAEIAPEHLAASLKAFLSTLSLLSLPGMVFKISLPDHLEPAISHASGLHRRRIEGLHLRWETPYLKQLVERRLALAFGQQSFPLERLCNTPKLLSWLEKVGGTSPREWLDQVAVLVEHYASLPRPAPINEDTWKHLRAERPPRFYLDELGRRVIVGGREINLEELPPKVYEVLCYLYRRGDHVVTKAELYYRIYRHLDRIPRPGDPEYEGPKEYAGVIDTTLWRLRQAIEPDPEDPVLLITRRGHGVRLRVRW